MKIRLLLVVGALVILLFVMVLSVPIIVRSQIESNLTDLFEAPASLAAVSINPFSGQLALRDIAIGDDIALAHLAVTINMAALLDRQIHMERVQINGLQLPVSYQQDQLSIGKLRLPLTETDSAEGATEAQAPTPLVWQVDQLLLEDNVFAVRYGEQAHQVTVPHLSVASIRSDMTTAMSYQLDLRIDASQLSAQGQISLATPLSVTSQLQAELRLSDWQAYLPVALSGDLRLNQQLSLTQGDELQLEATGALKIDEFSIGGERPLAMRQLGWEGKNELLLGQADQLQLQTTGSLRVDQISVGGEQPLAIGQLNWQVNNQLSLSQGDQLQLAATGSLQVDEISVGGRLPLAVGQLSWQGSNQLSVLPEAQPQVRADGVLTLADVVAEPLGSIEQLSITNVQLDAGLLTIQDVLVSGLNLALQRQADGSITGLPLSSSEPPAAVAIDSAESSDAAATEAPVTAEPAALQWRIETLAVNGGLRFNDASVEPAVSLLLHKIDLKISPLGQGLQSDILLQANHQAERQTGSLLLQGKGFVLDEPLNAEMTLALSGFELHQLSAYLGNGIRSGRLALDAAINIQQGKINATNRVRINGLKVDAGQARQVPGAGLPLSMALDLLKDSDGHIDLKVPIQSDLQGFAVDTSDIVNTAILNAARKAAFAYVKQALQPLGALMLLKDVAEAAARPRFVPVSFPPGTVELSAETQRYVAQIATLLTDRPALTITLCGVATDADRQALIVTQTALESQPAQDNARVDLFAESKSVESQSVENQPVDTNAEAATLVDAATASVVPESDLLALAVARGQHVTALLVDAGILVERLYACRPSYVADDSLPRVELSL